MLLAFVREEKQLTDAIILLLVVTRGLPEFGNFSFSRLRIPLSGSRSRCWSSSLDHVPGVGVAVRFWQLSEPLLF